jgi:hypothetical protein
MLNDPGNDLAVLGTGRRVLHQVPFQVDGTVMVGPGRTGYPENPIRVLRVVKGIRVGQRLDRLYFLHGAHYLSPSLDGLKVGAYLVHYEDGTQREITIRAGVDLADWWDNGTRATAAPIVWTGTNPSSASTGQSLRLFLKSWQNPRPSVAIQSLDFVCGDQPGGPGAAAPFLVAVTGMLPVRRLP